MSEFNIDNIKALARDAYSRVVFREFGDEGTRALVKLLDAIRLLYQRCPPEKIQGKLIIFTAVTPQSSHSVTGLSASTRATSCREAGLLMIERSPAGGIAVELTADSSYVISAAAPTFLPDQASASALVYVYEDGVEFLSVRGQRISIPKVSNILKSNFAAPTHSSLEAALQKYGKEMALETRCKILAGVWIDGVDGPRLVLSNKPESLMRDSLVQALQIMLDDATVHPEHNTDETKPVDIKVEWFASGSTALIEVKWLGRSLALPRDGSTAQKYTKYDSARAQSGANQLADYLDRESRFSSSTAPMGYLVVFDARRNFPRGQSGPLAKGDALHYANSDIAYDPDHATLRSDFSSPHRFFMKPRESHFSAH